MGCTTTGSTTTGSIENFFLVDFLVFFSNDAQRMVGDAGNHIWHRRGKASTWTIVISYDLYSHKILKFLSNIKF